MTELFVNAFFAVRGFHGNLFERARTERGASMVEYALILVLISVVVIELQPRTRMTEEA